MAIERLGVIASLSKCGVGVLRRLGAKSIKYAETLLDRGTGKALAHESGDGVFVIRKRCAGSRTVFDRAATHQKEDYREKTNLG
jgi:hypothetical protein